MQKITKITLLAEPIPGDAIQVKAWCPHCVAWHLHGRGCPNAKGDLGHRAAHCESGPFRDAGYWLLLRGNQ